jgi:hypothetical protein
MFGVTLTNKLMSFRTTQMFLKLLPDENLFLIFSVVYLTTLSVSRIYSVRWQEIDE